MAKAKELLWDKTAGPKNAKDKKQFLNPLNWLFDGKDMEEWKEQLMAALEEQRLEEIGVETVDDEDAAEFEVRRLAAEYNRNPL